MTLPRAASLALLGLLACGSAGRNVAPSTPAAPDHPAAQPLQAQADPGADQPLPLWPAVTHGVLPNGLTYSILKHGKPEKRAFLWLAVNAGSVLEDEDQRGLAHFDEHMAFDGTRRFKKSAIIDYIEKIGMRFGADLNAYTNFDQTVYQLEVPTDEPQFLTTGLDILRDWAGDVTYDPAEVERERSVVLEEWRLGRGAGSRLFDKQAKVDFQGSRYADRLTIGLPAVIKNAPREALLRFYKDFYRPDLMSVIVVGDVDPAWIQREIAARFGDLKNPASEKPRQHAGQPVADGTRISIEADRELPGAGVSVWNLVPSRPEATLQDFRRSLIEQLYSDMLGARLEEVRREPGSALRSAGGGISAITREIDGFVRSAEVKGGKVDEALRSLFTEVLRVEAHGFAKSELERARASIQRGYDESLAREATVNSRELTAELVRNFLSGEFVVGARTEHDLATQLLPSISLEEVNAAGARFAGDKNRVILISGPDAAQLPSEARVKEIVAQVEAAKPGPWDDGATGGPLLARPPKPGTIVSEKTLDAVGVTEWTLSNGVRVVVKPTDFEADAVSIQGFAPGGLALIDDAQFDTARFADSAVESGGLGTMGPVALRKALAGKSATASVAWNEQQREVQGGGAARDLETILQLVYLRMTAPRADAKEFQLWKANSLERLADQQRIPEFQFGRASAAMLYQGNPRRLPPAAADLEPLKLEDALGLYQRNFGDASGFTFVIVGSVELPALKTLVATYLASLPASGRKEEERDLKLRKLSGRVAKSWKFGEEPKASVSVDFHGDEPWSRDRERDLYILGRVLSIRLREVLRNDLGGVYGVSASGSLLRSPHQERSFQIRFGCDPKNVDKLLAATEAELKNVAANGASEELLAKVQKAYLRERETSLRENRYWSARLALLYRYGDDPALILDSASTVARMTPAYVKEAARIFLDETQRYQAVMLPEKETAAAPAK